MSDAELWRFLPLGYACTVLIEAPILFFGLSRRHPPRVRLIAGFWLTACTYPIVVLVLPSLLDSSPRWLYLAIAETFAPAAECALVYLAYGRKPQESPRTRDLVRDGLVIVAANVASFLGGLVITSKVL